MTIEVGAATVTQSLLFPNTVATANSNASYCGPNSYVFTPSLDTLDFLSFAGTTLTGTSNDFSHVSSTLITVTVSLANYPTVSPLSRSFTVDVICFLTAINPSSPMTPIEYFIGDAQISTPIPAFTVNPSGCPHELTYTVTMSDDSVLPAQFTFDATTGSEAINVFTTD